MSTKTTAAANADLDDKYGDGAGFYVAALSAIANAAAGTVTEITDGNAARVHLDGLLAAATGREKASTGDVTLPLSNTDHGNIVGWAITDAPTGGVIHHVIPLATAIPYNINFQPVIQAGNLVIAEGDWADPNA